MFSENELNNMKSIIAFVSSYKYGKFNAIILGSLTLILQLEMQLYFLFTLMAIDFVTGIYRSVSNSRNTNPLKMPFWRTVTSNKMRSSISKLSQYMVVILASLAIQVLFFHEGRIELMSLKFTIPRIIVLLLSVIEIYSIAENMTPAGKESLLAKVEKTYIRFYMIIFKGERCKNC